MHKYIFTGIEYIYIIIQLHPNNSLTREKSKFLRIEHYGCVTCMPAISDRNILNLVVVSTEKPKY